MKRTIPLVTAGIGVLALVLSALWPVLFPPERSWTEDKSQQMADLSSRAHLLHVKVKMARPERGSDKPGYSEKTQQEYEEVTSRLESLKEELETAKEKPQTVATILKWSGLVMAGVGVAGWVATRQG